MRREFKKVIEKIKSSRSFLITAHMNLEGDALGSELAMYLLLKKLKKKNVVIYNHDPVPESYKFLPYSRNIKTSLKGQKFDVALVLDCSDSFRTGKVKNYLNNVGCIINIDHHISNTLFGDINWVEPNRISTCEILYWLCDRFHVMDKNIALCLYTGIFTDSGSFTYANTNANTHKIISQLMKYPIHPNYIYESLNSCCVLADLKIMSNVFSLLELDANKKICWAKLNHWQEGQHDLTETVFGMMRLLKGVEVFILFKKVDKNKVRVSFRSRGKINVNRVAKFFGGGGHKNASGTTTEDTLSGAEKKIIAFVKRYTDRLKK